MKDVETILQNPDLNRLILQAFHSILSDTDSMLFIKDANLIYQAANMPFVHMVGKKYLDDVIGHTDFDIFDDQLLAQRYVADDRRLFAGDQSVVTYIEPLPDQSGRTRFARTSKYVLRDEENRVIGLAGISRDATHEIVSAEDHQKEISYLFSLPGDAFMAVLIDVTDWRIIGERLQEIHSLSFRKHENATTLAQKACRNAVDRRGSACLFYRDFRPAALQEIYESGRRNIVMEYLRRFSNDEERWVRDEINLLVDPTNNHLCLVLTVRDIHMRKLEELNLLWAAERDEMTGILNRGSLIKYSKDFLGGEGHLDLHAVFLIDIDNFKQINDTYGHQAGDQFLVHIAHTIRDSFRDSDLVGRIGGDEFVVLMKYIPNAKIAEEKGRALLFALKQACRDVSNLDVSGSVGISLYDQDGKSFDELYEKADRAMYLSKRRGKGCLFLASDLPDDD